MNNSQEFSDEELTAFLDGEFEHTRAEEIRRALKNDSDVQARIDTLSLNKPKIDAAFDQLLNVAPSMPDLPDTAHHETSIPVARCLKLIAVFSFVFLLAGLGAGYFAGQTKDENWREFVATYQALYIHATLEGIDQKPDVAGIELDRVSQAIGKKVDLPSLVQQKQLDYKRAQILGFEGRPLMQLTFLTKLGEPIALCIIRSEMLENSKVVVSEMRGMQAASWARDGYEYLLIGGRDRALIKNAAVEFAKNL